MRVLILTSLKPGNIFKVNYLEERFNVVGRVIEKPEFKSNFKKKLRIQVLSMKKHGALRTLNRYLFLQYKQRVLDRVHDKIVRNMLFPGNRQVQYNKKVPNIFVGNINDTKAIQFIRGKQPDIIAVCGTSLLKPDTFNLSKHGTINIHSGITPEYRSNESTFWALYNGEPEYVGVTIHYIDEGIDTGEILYQESMGVDARDNLATLYCKCQQTGVALMAKAIEDIQKGRTQTIDKANRISRAYFSIDLGIIEYLGFLKKMRQLKHRLARQPWSPS